MIKLIVPSSSWAAVAAIESLRLTRLLIAASCRSSTETFHPSNCACDRYAIVRSLSIA